MNKRFYSKKGYRVPTHDQGGESMSIQCEFAEGDRVYVKAGATVYKGDVTEVEDHGIWITLELETEEFLSFDDLKGWEWAIE